LTSIYKDDLRFDLHLTISCFASQYPRKRNTFNPDTCTTSPYWSLVSTVTMAGHPHLISSREYSASHWEGSTKLSGCSHRASLPPLVPAEQETKSRRN